MPLHIPTLGERVTEADIWSYVTRALTNLSDTRAGYIDLIGAIPTTPELEASALARYTALGVLIGAIPTTPELEASALARYDIIKAQTDKIPRGIYSMSFWSDNDDDITLTTAATDDFALPSIVVAGLPVDITLVRVVAILKIALIKDTSGADNAINGATALKVDADPAYGSLVTAIDIPDNSWAVDFSESTERGGDVMIGDNDIKAEVTIDATYYARLENISCDGNNLKLKDIAWGLKFYFTV